MPAGLGGCSARWRVASVAVADSAGVVNPGTAREGCSGVTGGTVQAGRNMGRYGIHHACRRITIMAGCAIVGDAGMIKRRRHETTGGMTDTTVLIGVDMIDFFGCSETGIMTGGAVVHDARMTKGRRFKTRGHVTVATVSVGRHMEIGFAGSANTIMTGRAREIR